MEYWTSQPVDVYLVIRDAERKIRWMNVTRYLNDRADKASRQIVFSGDEVTTEQLWRVRDIYAGLLETLQRHGSRLLAERFAPGL